MTWTAPTYSLGFVVALVIFLVSIILAALGQLDKQAALLICAVCAVRL